MLLNNDKLVLKTTQLVESCVPVDHGSRTTEIKLNTSLIIIVHLAKAKMMVVFLLQLVLMMQSVLGNVCLFKDIAQRKHYPFFF